MKEAVLLAWEGHLNFLEIMQIENVDITDIPPTDQMGKLTSIATDRNWVVEVSMPSSLGDTTMDIEEQTKYDGWDCCNVLMNSGG